MSKALECALSLADEFHKAQYLDQVDEKTMKALALLMTSVLDQNESDQVMKALAKIDPEIDVSDITPETIENNPKLTKEQSLRLMFWTLAIIGTLMEMEDPGFMGPMSPAEKEEAEARTKEWAEEMRRDLEQADPAFARYVFGPA